MRSRRCHEEREVNLYYDKTSERSEQGYIFMESLGQGPTVVLIHGWGCTAACGGTWRCGWRVRFGC